VANGLNHGLPDVSSYSEIFAFSAALILLGDLAYAFSPPSVVMYEGRYVGQKTISYNWYRRGYVKFSGVRGCYFHPVRSSSIF
jgi:hypothetical protein